MNSVEKRQFLSLIVTTALFRRVKTLCSWPMCFVGDLEKTTMSSNYMRAN